MTKNEALKLALSYLLTDPKAFLLTKEQLVTAIREALAQPEHEPVAWESVLGAVARGWCHEENANKTMDSELAVAIAKEVHALYTTPPQRKPLTDEELQAIADKCRLYPRDFARAIEAAHGIKE